MLDNTISFLNEYDIENEKLDEDLKNMMRILSTMLVNMDELLDFYELSEEYKEVKS